MTLDIFFERYLLTLHAIVVAFGLIVYVGVARALPQRRDPSAAIAWVVALALLPYVAIPLYLMFGSRKLLMRDAPALLPPIAPRGRGRRRGGVALGAPPRPLDGPGACRAVRSAAHPRGRRGGAPRRARRHRRRDAHARRLHLHPRPRPPRRRDRGGAAGEGRARRPRSPADRRHRRLVVGPPRRPRAAPRRGRGGHLRAAVSLDPARPRQPAQPPQDDRRRRDRGSGAAAATSPPSISKAIPTAAAASSGTTSASTCTASSASVPPSSSRRTGTTRPGAAAAPTSFPRRTGSCRPTHRSPSWCRAAPSRSTTPCRRCSCRAASWRSGASSP